MNCRQFRRQLQKNQEDLGWDGEIRRGLDEHSRDCPSCAAKLENELALRFALQALARDLEGKAAPPHVEYRLREACRRSRLLPQSPARQSRIRWLEGFGFSELVAAAALLIALGAALGGWEDSSRLRGEGLAVESEFKGAEEGTASGLPDSRIETLSGSGEQYKYEINTDFIDLGNSQDPDYWNGVQLLRVQLPRSSLLLFGLPMNTGRAEEKIPADVLVGEDGVARAIRFVYSTDLDRIN